MAKFTAEDIIRIVEEENVRFIRLQFTDIFGSFKNIAITASQLQKALDNKCMFDGSSIEGFVRIEDSAHLRRLQAGRHAFRGGSPRPAEKGARSGGRDGIHGLQCRPGM